MTGNPLQEMQRRQQEEQKFNLAVTHKYQSTSFPTTPEMTQWFEDALFALEFASPVSTGLSPAEFIGLVTAATSVTVTVFQMGALCNNLEARSAHDLEMSLEDYTNLLEETAAYVTQWQGIANKIVADLQAQRTESGKMMEAAFREPMQVIKAEA